MPETLTLTIVQQRALLTEKRDRYLALALDAKVEAIAISVQRHGVTDKERNRAVLQYSDKAANCQAAAEEVEKLLNALPDEPKPTPEPDPEVP